MRSDWNGWVLCCVLVSVAACSGSKGPGSGPGAVICTPITSAQCLPPGCKPQSNAACCVGTDPTTGQCGCLNGGYFIQSSGDADLCCTGAATADGLFCACTPTGSEPPGGNAKNCCSSQADSATGLCACLPPGALPSGFSAEEAGKGCCAGFLDSSLTCGCAPIGSSVPQLDPRNCCSGRDNDAGLCACVPIGNAPPGGSVALCCSSTLGDAGVCTSP